MSAARWGWLAAEALRVEARLTPKPGLVDAETNGAHDDMDLPLLLASADALEPWLVECGRLGSAAPGDVAAVLRAGVAAEAAMRAATGGVNTHKGALFSLGLACFAGGELGFPTGPEGVAAVCARVGEIATPLLARWLASGVVGRSDPSTAQVATHGERVCAATGLSGARGEAASGFATVREHGLPRYRRALAAGDDEETALLRALVELMAANPDTNLVARGGMVALTSVRAWAASLAVAELPADELRAALRVADRNFTAERWSPGGSADLLALTWFFGRLRAAG